MKKIIILGAVTIVTAFTLTGCDSWAKFTEPFNDAPRSANEDNSAAQVITMPDGFSNLATKCVNGMRYTVAYHGDNTYGAISVTADPKCGR